MAQAEAEAIYLGLMTGSHRGLPEVEAPVTSTRLEGAERTMSAAFLPGEPPLELPRASIQTVRVKLCPGR